MRLSRFAPLAVLTLLALLRASPGEAVPPAPVPAPSELAPAASAPDDCTVAAIVGGKPVTYEELDALGPPEVYLIADDLYRTRLAALDELVALRLIEQEAKRLGLTASAFLDAATRQGIPEPTDEEIDALWKSAPSGALAGTKEELRPRLVEYLKDRSAAARERALIARLRAAHEDEVEVRMRSPRRDVPADGAPSRGPADALVTLVLFADYQCGACAFVSRVVSEVARTAPDQVRVLHRDWPNKGHDRAMSAAVAARCAGRFGRYWEFHDALFLAEEASTEEGIQKIASDLGLDAEGFAACRSLPEVAAAVAADRALGERLGITGTPALFVNGLPILGAIDTPLLAKVIEGEVALAASSREPSGS